MIRTSRLIKLPLQKASKHFWEKLRSKSRFLSHTFEAHHIFLALPVPTKFWPSISMVILKVANTSVVSVQWYLADGYNSLTSITACLGVPFFCACLVEFLLFSWPDSNTSLVKSSLELLEQFDGSTLQLSGNWMNDFKACSAALHFASFFVLPAPVYYRDYKEITFVKNFANYYFVWIFKLRLYIFFKFYNFQYIPEGNTIEKQHKHLGYILSEVGY